MRLIEPTVHIANLGAPVHTRSIRSMLIEVIGWRNTDFRYDRILGVLTKAIQRKLPATTEVTTDYFRGLVETVAWEELYLEIGFDCDCPSCLAEQALQGQ